MNYSELLGDLRTEADLCRNETADDIAQLLDAAADAIEASQSALRQLRSDVLSVMPANWREDPDWVALADAQKLTSNAIGNRPPRDGD
jgi:hypothetical protein